MNLDPALDLDLDLDPPPRFFPSRQVPGPLPGVRVRKGDVGRVHLPALQGAQRGGALPLPGLRAGQRAEVRERGHGPTRQRRTLLADLFLHSSNATLFCTLLTGSFTL